MKKIFNLSLSIAVITLFACGSEPNNETTEEASTEEAIENHAAHDHAEVQASADGNEMNAVPEGASISFGNIQDGDLVQSPFKVEMKVEGINVHPAGEVIQSTGHHHIIIDAGPVPFGEIVPADDLHIHFGGGQLETEIELEPGLHELTLQFADGLHRSYGDELSVTIRVQVAETE